MFAFLKRKKKKQKEILIEYELLFSRAFEDQYIWAFGLTGPWFKPGCTCNIQAVVGLPKEPSVITEELCLEYLAYIIEKYTDVDMSTFIETVISIFEKNGKRREGEITMPFNVFVEKVVEALPQTEPIIQKVKEAVEDIFVAPSEEIEIGKDEVINEYLYLFYYLANTS